MTIIKLWRDSNLLLETDVVLVNVKDDRILSLILNFRFENRLRFAECLVSGKLKHLIVYRSKKLIRLFRGKKILAVFLLSASMIDSWDDRLLLSRANVANKKVAPYYSFKMRSWIFGGHFRCVIAKKYVQYLVHFRQEGAIYVARHCF